MRDDTDAAFISDTRGPVITTTTYDQTSTQKDTSVANNSTNSDGQELDIQEITQEGGQ